MPRVNGTAAWKWVPIVGGGLGAAVVIGGMLYALFHFIFVAQENANDIIVMRTEQQKARSEFADELNKIKADLAAKDVIMRAITHDISEVQTQICAEDDLRNLMHSNVLRELAVIHEKAFNAPYPIGTAYYPRVCNRTPTAR